MIGIDSKNSHTLELGELGGFVVLLGSTQTRQGTPFRVHTYDTSTRSHSGSSFLEIKS